MDLFFPFGVEEEGALQILWEDGERVFCRGWRPRADGHRLAVLAVAPAVEHPPPATLDRLAHEYGLKDELDAAWAARPLELVQQRGRTMLVLEVSPAAYINFAANEAEKNASIELIHISGLGRFGRM